MNDNNFVLLYLYTFVIGFTGGKVLKDKSNAMLDETENTTTDVLNQTVKQHAEWWIKEYDR